MTDQVRPPANAARGGRAIGAMFFSAFGGAWLALWGYSEFSPPLLALSAVGVGTLALFLWSIATYRENAEALRIESQTPEAKRRSRLFNLINAGQWVTIFVLASILGKLQHQDLILPAVILVIGLHFLPLARMFSYRPHYITGITLVVLALSYPILSAEGAQSASGALGTGLVLWLSAIWALLPHSSSTHRRDDA
jgi:hypothetical protein